VRRALFAAVAAGAIGAATIAGLHPVWFALSKLGMTDPIIDDAFWQQSMPAIGTGLVIGATALTIADRRPRLAIALLLLSPVVAYLASFLILALTL